MHWYLDVLKKYAVFTGRASRSEFWMFFLINLIISIALSLIDRYLRTSGAIGSLYSLAVLVPGIAVSVRRLHDTGRSGWWFLLVLIPCIGSLVLLVFFVQDSEPGSNQYGPNPRAAFA
jgi:uncharacterized membrane protein YhaH (DUF805 family)